LPVHVQEEVSKLWTITQHLAEMLDIEHPDISDIASEMGVSEQRVLDLMRWSKDSISLDKGLDDTGETTIGDMIADQVLPSVDTQVIAHDQTEIVKLIHTHLDERSADIIIRRFGFIDGKRLTLEDVARRYDLSRESIRVIERKALATLRLTGAFSIDGE
jgi:DNA-directed RNA polymerase sigma subunit (sigma70/sigma32)